MQIEFKQVEGYQYVGLFLVLVGVLFVYPYLQTGQNEFVVSALLALIPTMAIIALVESRAMAIVGIVLGAPATMAILNQSLGHPFGSGLIYDLTPLAFYFYATAVICYHVVTETRVKADTLLGAICGYLMLGYTWSVAYITLIAFDPSSFASTHGSSGYAATADSFYFSFVTLTTLGYGDVVPLTAKARSLAMMESITGVLYLAVLVARLVAMYGAAERERIVSRVLSSDSGERS